MHGGRSEEGRKTEGGRGDRRGDQSAARGRRQRTKAHESKGSRLANQLLAVYVKGKVFTIPG
jgi:hypothetical protein